MLSVPEIGLVHQESYFSTTPSKELLEDEKTIDVSVFFRCKLGFGST